MAATNLRVHRRPKGSTARRRSLTAASQMIDTPRQLRGSMKTVVRSDWQTEAWDLLDQVGELRYYVGWRASSCSRVRLIASELDDDGVPTGGIHPDNTEGVRVANIVKQIAGGPLGQAQLIRRAVECLTVPGELWLAVLVRDDGEHWLALTREEMTDKPGGGTDIEMPDGTKHTFRQGVDSLVRVWNPHPRRARECDSPVRACLDPLREIVRTSKKIRNASKSRLIGNGVLFLPQEMMLPAAAAPVPEADADIPGAPMPVLQGVPAAEQLNNLLYNVAKVAVDDEDSQAAFIPIMATVPGEHMSKITHIKFANEVTEVEIKTRNDAIARLAMGLDVSPERLLGLGSTTNHWSAWAIGDQDVQLHIKPAMETLVQAINDHILRTVLVREGIDPDRYVLWYDASQLTTDPDLTDEATEAHDRGAITSEAYRRYLGLGDDAGYDLTTWEGAQAWARDAVTKNPELIRTLAPLLSDELGSIEFPAPVRAITPPGIVVNPDEDDEDSGAGREREPDTEQASATAAVTAATNGHRPGHRITTPAEVILAERLLVNRALDLAAKRRVRSYDRDQHDRLRGFPPHEWHRYLPPVAEDEIPRLIRGWDTALEDDVIARLNVDTDQLRDAVRRQVRAALTQPLVDAEVD